MEEWEGALKDFHQLTFPDPPVSLRGRHLQWSCLHEKESLSPHGCTSLGTESVWAIVVQACANRCKEWFLGKRKLSSFRLGIDMEFHCFVERTLIWRFLPAPHPINRTPHDMGRVCFSFFFFFFFSFFCPLRISLSVEWPDLSSYHPLNFYSSVYSDSVFVN